MSTTEVSVSRPEVPPQNLPSAKRASSGFFSRRSGWALCLAVLLAVGIGRIVSTYRVFNHTIDEPSHIACGIEWWEKGIYTIETKHAPLARISVALGPYLAGVRGTGAKNWWDTYPILSADGHYWRNLILGRIGVLPYYVIATLLVFFWTKRLFGAPIGLLAAAIFSLLPAVLAHSAVATTDIPLMAMFCCSVYAFTLWLRELNWRTAVEFGITAGLAFATKFSTLVFLPACAAIILVLYVAAGNRNWRPILRTAFIAGLCAFFAIWAVYRFSHAPSTEVTKFPERAAAKIFGKSSGITNAVHTIAVHVPVPAPEVFDGLRMVRKQNEEGTKSFLFGHVRTGGWWYFFFVAIALKTPLSVLLLAALGSVIILLRYWKDRSQWETMVPLAAAVMVMIVTIPSRFNIGVRHVLPMFVFLSIPAAVGLAALWERRDQRLISRAAVVLLGAWLVISSARSHPDYLSYFNEFGGHDPSRLLVISDYDWGQDLARLSTYLHDQQIKHISITYDGWFVPESLGFPETDNITLNCGTRPSGWVAMQVRRARVHPDCYPWLAQEHRVTTVGKTMWIYYVKP